MLEAIADRLTNLSIPFDPKKLGIRCLGHIINLVVKSFLFGENHTSLEFPVGSGTPEEEIQQLWEWQKQDPWGSYTTVYGTFSRPPNVKILPHPCLCTPVVVSLRYPSSMQRYSASPLSLHSRHGLVVVSFLAAAVSCLTLVFARSAWSRCGILRHCSGILPRLYRSRFLTDVGHSTGSWV